MISKHAEINIDTNWTELSEDFDILSFGLYSESEVEFQEYGLSGWGSTESNIAGEPFYKETSVKKLRVRSTSGTISLNYSLWGFIAFRVVESTGSGDMLKSTYDQDDDGIVDKAEGIDDGEGNSATAAEIKEAVDNTHTIVYDGDYECYIIGY
jgi:hypothetical protein